MSLSLSLSLAEKRWRSIDRDRVDFNEIQEYRESPESEGYTCSRGVSKRQNTGKLTWYIATLIDPNEALTRYP